MFGLFKSSKEASKLSWKELDSTEQLNELIEKSQTENIIIFKHSTRCSISSMAKSRMELGWTDDRQDVYYLDIIQHRDVSNEIESRLNLVHQSPQVLVLQKGNVIYNASHGGINADEVLNHSN